MAGLLLAGLAGCQKPAATAPQGPPRAEFLHVNVQELFELPTADSWSPRTPELWSVAAEGDRRFFRMTEPPQRPMLEGVRRPQEYAVYSPYEFRSFSLSARVRVDRDPAVKARDAVIIFGMQDPTHFYYAHLAGGADEAHNTLWRVDGQTRTRMLPADVRPPPAMPDLAWHKVDVIRDADTGLIQVFVDAYDPAAKPLFEATDKTYEWGRVAIGSFDDFASFARVLIEGQGRKAEWRAEN